MRILTTGREKYVNNRVLLILNSYRVGAILEMKCSFQNGNKSDYYTL